MLFLHKNLPLINRIHSIFPAIWSKGGCLVGKERVRKEEKKAGKGGERRDKGEMWLEAEEMQGCHLHWLWSKSNRRERKTGVKNRAAWLKKKKKKPVYQCTPPCGSGNRKGQMQPEISSRKKAGMLYWFCRSWGGGGGEEDKWDHAGAGLRPGWDTSECLSAFSNETHTFSWCHHAWQKMIEPGAATVNMAVWTFLYISPPSFKCSPAGKYLLTNNISHTADRETVWKGMMKFFSLAVRLM